MEPEEPLPARRPLRIALVTETWPPEVNGVATTIARVAEGLRQRGHALQVLRPRQPADASGPAPEAMPPEGPDVLLRGLPIPRYPHLRMGLPALRALHALWRQRRPDVVHIATEGPLGWSALQAARRLRLPVTSDFRTNFHAYSRHYGIGLLQRPIEAYLRHFHNRTHCTMVPTETLRRELQGAGFERLQVVARGVDTQRFSPAHRSEVLRRSWGAAPADPVLLYVGRLAPEKNLDTLLQAYEAMCGINPALRLVLVGDGPLRPTLQARWPQAVFAGTRRGEELAAHYASGDLFLFPSLTETYGNVTPEALASGLPVLAFDHAAASQLVKSGENGELAPAGDNAAFVRLAAAWASQPRAACAMGMAARRSALALDWERIVRQIEGVFAAAMQAGDAPQAEPLLAAGWE